jgi:two-component system, NtrC family, sensor kinase
MSPPAPATITAEPPAALLDDAAHMNAAALVRHHVRVERQYQFAPPVLGEKAKALQILVNLIANAKYASDERGATDKVVTLRVEPMPPGRVRLIIADNGVGIAPENLTKIFQHGFTMSRHGHGFGLHSSANAAKEMKGSLTAHSDGPGRGASFTLELPAAAPAIPADL